MNRVIATLLAMASCASIAEAQTVPTAAPAQPLTLARALELAQTVSPEMEAATAGIRAAEAGQRIAGVRPNPSVSADIENVGGSRAYDAIEAPKQTVSLALPVELGGKRSARLGVADAQADRAGIDRAATTADLRLAVTKAYIEAVAAERRLVEARQQATIAGDGVRAAHVRVTAGRASPLEEQRADVLRINAQAAVDRAARLADLARANLARFLGRPVSEPLDAAWFERVDSYGPRLPRTGTLAIAAARADEASASAHVRLARSQRIPDVTLSAGARRLPINNDVAAVFGISVPLPLFNDGSAALAQANAERQRAEAQRRTVERDAAQAIAETEAELDNAAAAARTATGPVLASAQEAARIARIGYAEGKFGQLDLLDAERTLAETRAAATDALAAYHDAQARLDRLTATFAKD